MVSLNNRFILSANEKKKLNSNIKIGIYKELGVKSLLTANQVSFLTEKEKKLLNLSK